MKKVACIILLVFLASCAVNPEESKGIEVTTYDPDATYSGTTFTVEVTDPSNPRILEIDMAGEILWEYTLKEATAGSTAPDAELLDNGNILLLINGYGIQEINREGTVIWEYLDEDVSHDADRLENGNTLINFGQNDAIGDKLIKEVNEEGEVVWSWDADQQYREEYTENYGNDWTHANAVQRLDDGSTLLSLRNFYLTIFIDEEGNVFQEFDWTNFGEDVDPHEPVILENGNLLVCLQNDASVQAIEVTLEGDTVWSFYDERLRTARDCDRLPNGNTLIQAVDASADDSIILEVTEAGEIVWEFHLEGSVTQSPGKLYKAQRVG